MWCDMLQYTVASIIPSWNDRLKQFSSRAVYGSVFKAKYSTKFRGEINRFPAHHGKSVSGLEFAVRVGTPSCDVIPGCVTSDPDCSLAPRNGVSGAVR